MSDYLVKAHRSTAYRQGKTSGFFWGLVAGLWLAWWSDFATPYVHRFLDWL